MSVYIVYNVYVYIYIIGNQFILLILNDTCIIFYDINIFNILSIIW